MAQTTSHVASSKAVVSLDTAGGTLTDISGSNTTCEITITTPIEEDFTFSGDTAITTVGKDSVEIALEIIYSTSADEGMDILKRWKFGSDRDGPRTLQVDIPDSSTGSDRYSAEVNLGDLTIPSAADEFKPRRVSATLRNDGPFTWTLL